MSSEVALKDLATKHSINESESVLQIGPRVIIVVAGIYSSYHHQIVECLRKKMSPLGFGILCITGREITSDLHGSGLPSIYRLATRLNVAGTIVMGGSLGHDLDQIEVYDFVRRFKNHRLIALDISNDSWSSVVFNNEAAIRSLVEHVLDQVPGDNIAFLAGFSSSFNSFEREAAFRNVMAERGRKVDESLILPARYSAMDSYKAIDNLLKSGRCPNAIIAANDAMASGAIDALLHNGKTVPADVLVTGFDDDDYASSASVPITTIRACPKLQMEMVADELLRLIKAGDNTDVKQIRLTGEMILRDSTLRVDTKGNQSQTSETRGSNNHSADADLQVNQMSNKFYVDSMASHEAREHFHVRLARCNDRDSVFQVFDEAMQALSIRRAFLLDVVLTENGDIECASLLHTWPSRKILDQEISYTPDFLLPHGISQELLDGTLVICGVESDGESVCVLLYDPAGPDRASMDGLAQTTFGALRHFDQCYNLEQQAQEIGYVNEELVRLLNTDPLTGLANRSRLLSELKTTLDHGGEESVVFFFDLNGFKSVNDTLGHAAGDRVLKIMAKRLCDCLREPDIVARFGGDEFVVLMRNLHTSDEIDEIFTKLLAEVSRPMSLSRDNRLTLSASIGVVSLTALKSASPDMLLQQADTAMYRAKAMGGNQIVWFDNVLAKEVGEQLHLEQVMHDDLNRGRFRLAFQPRVELATGRIVAVEALLRWRRIDGTDIKPETFIEIAEKSGMVSRLDEFAFTTACAVAADWYQRGIDCCISVNLSVARLQQPCLVADVKSLLAKHKLPPDRLEFELTETTVMTDIDANVNTLQQLRAIGIRLAIDDFGTAYSSLSYLRNLPVDCLKIDRVFISTIVNRDASDNSDAQIMRAAIALGKGLGLRVVAEGVENEAQLNFLVSVGCDEAQGFLFSEPLELDSVEIALLENTAECSGR